jgi:hypothetical protein
MAVAVPDAVIGTRWFWVPDAGSPLTSAGSPFGPVSLLIETLPLSSPLPAPQPAIAQEMSAASAAAVSSRLRSPGMLQP